MSTIAHRRISRLTKELLPIDRGRRRCGLARCDTRGRRHVGAGLAAKHLMSREYWAFQDSRRLANPQGASDHYWPLN